MKLIIIILASLVSFFSLLGVVIAAKSFGFNPANFHNPEMVFDPLTLLTALAVMIVPALIALFAQKLLLKERLSTVGFAGPVLKPFISGTIFGISVKVVATLLAFWFSAKATVSLTNIPVGVSEFFPYAAWFLIALLLNSFSEEFVYRSFPLGNLWRDNKILLIAIGLIWAAAFSLAHFFIEPVDVVRFFYRFSFGFLAALMFIRSRSLWEIVGLHTGWNLVALSVGDSDWRNGGIVSLTGLAENSEGIFNTIILLVASAAFTLLILRSPRRVS